MADCDDSVTTPSRVCGVACPLHSASIAVVRSPPPTHDLFPTTGAARSRASCRVCGWHRLSGRAGGLPQRWRSGFQHEGVVPEFGPRGTCPEGEGTNRRSCAARSRDCRRTKLQWRSARPTSRCRRRKGVLSELRPTWGWMKPTRRKWSTRRTPGRRPARFPSCRRRGASPGGRGGGDALPRPSRTPTWTAWSSRMRSSRGLWSCCRAHSPPWRSFPQMRLVYRIGNAFGYELDRGHIRTCSRPWGVGLTSQVIEGFPGKGGPGVLGKVAGELGRAWGAGCEFRTFLCHDLRPGAVGAAVITPGARIQRLELKSIYESSWDRRAHFRKPTCPRSEAQAGKLNSSHLLRFRREVVPPRSPGNGGNYSPTKRSGGISPSACAGFRHEDLAAGDAEAGCWRALLDVAPSTSMPAPSAPRQLELERGIELDVLSCRLPGERACWVSLSPPG